MVLKKAGKTLPNVKLNSIVNLLKIKKNCDLQWDIQRTNKKCKSNLSVLNVQNSEESDHLLFWQRYPWQDVGKLMGQYHPWILKNKTNESQCITKVFSITWMGKAFSKLSIYEGRLCSKKQIRRTLYMEFPVTLFS